MSGRKKFLATNNSAFTLFKLFVPIPSGMHGQDSNHPDDPSTRGLRNESRDSLFLLAKLSVVGGVQSEAVRIRNLSPSGLMAESEVLYAIGTAVMIELKPLPRFSGRVIWATDGRMGIAFDKEIDPRKVRQTIGGGKSNVPAFLKQAPGRRPGLKLI